MNTIKFPIAVLFSTLLLTSVSCSKQNKWDATGVFEATEITVSAEGNGKISGFTLQEGDPVTAGQVVGVIDTTLLHLQKKQIQASLSGTLSNTQDVNKQIASLQEQIAWQKSERTRFEQLYKANAATRKNLDDIENNIKVLEKELAARISSLSKGNKSISGQGEALENNIRLLQEQIERAIITCPVNGTVLNKYAEPGEFTTTGKPLFSVADLDQIFLRAYLTADQLSRLKIGDKVKVFSDYQTNDYKEYEGIISWISAKSEFTPKTIQTRNERANLVYAVKIRVKNDGLIKIGMYGEVVF